MPDTSSQVDDMTQADAAAPEAPVAPAAPHGDPAAQAAANRLMLKFASANSEADFREVQREILAMSGVAPAAAPPSRRDYAREASERRLKLLAMQEGETDEARAASFDKWELLSDYADAKHAPARQAEARAEARAAFTELLDELGIAPDDLRGLKSMREDALWTPVLTEFPNGRKYLAEAKDLKSKAARIGVDLDEREALFMAAKKSGKQPTPSARPNQSRPPVPTAEAGPAPAVERPGKTREATNAEIAEDFARQMRKPEFAERFRGFGNAFTRRPAQ